MPSTGQTKRQAINQTPSAKPRFSILKIGLNILLGLIVLLAVIVSFAWFNRYNFAENYVKSLFLEQGIKASLSIEALTKEAVIIREASLTYENEAKPFFKVKRLEADYELKEALQGRMKRLRFVEPEAKLTLNENFQIIDGWMPPRGQGKGQKFFIPPQGVSIEEGSFDVTTPFGSPEISFSAEVYETDRFSGIVLFQPTAFQYETWQGHGSARLELDVQGDEKIIDALVRLDTLSGEGLAVKDASLSAKGLLVADTTLPVETKTLDMTFQGEIDGRAAKIQTNVIDLSESRFDWDGKINRKTEAKFPVRFDGTLDLASDDFRLATPRRRRDVAEILSLSEAFSRTPIAQHFSPSLTRAVEGLLSGASVNANSVFKFDGQKARIGLSKPLLVQNNRNKLTIETSRPKDGLVPPVYEWSATDETLRLSFDAKMDKPVPLSMSRMAIMAKSPNGVELQRVETFKGRVETRTDWRAVSNGEEARLASFRADVNYDASASKRILKVTTPVNFDGRLPMGLVQGLKTQGQAIVTLPPAGQIGLSLSYAPTDPNIYLEKLSNETDWVLSDVSLTLRRSEDIFITRGNKALVEADLSNLSLIATNKIDGRDMRIASEAVRAKGDLSFTETKQNWNLALTNTAFESDTLPMQGTKAFIGVSQLKVDYSPTELNFDFKTPQMDMSVPQGQAKGVLIEANGTPDQFRVIHKGGVFETDAADIPNWPISGEVFYADEEFRGTARLKIPKAENVDAKIEYQYADGGGKAEITLDKLSFKPGGLQPQSFFPTLTGKITSVKGDVSADLFVSFEDGAVSDSGGVVRLIDMDFSTAPGPVKMLNSNIALDSLFPPQTTGVQSLTLEEFNPGIALKNGTVEYELLPDSIRISKAHWPLDGGAFTLDPLIWQYSALENRVVMRMQNIPAAALLKQFGNEKIEATGTVRGEFPIIVRGIKVLVDKGYLEAKDGGIIRYNPDEGTAVTYSQEEALNIIRRQDTAQYRSLARDALREFNYRELSLYVDGPLDGDVALGVVFDGRNKKVLNGQPFEFDINVTGELFNIARSFNSNAQVKSEILRQSRDNLKSP
jgi:hypothetical protein